MKRNLLILLFLLGYSFSAVAQNNDNNHNYIIVPLQYDFLKGKDKYRLNTQTRYLLKQDGFKVYFNEGEQLPEVLFKNRCLAFYADVEKVKGGFLKTKLKITFKDCNGNVVLESNEGASKIKDFNLAYKEALENAYVTIDFYKLRQMFVSQPQNNETTEQNLTETEAKKDIETQEEKDAVVSYLKTRKAASEVKQVKKMSEHLITDVEVMYYAQKIPEGFQVVDAQPKVVMLLLNTGYPNLFLVKDQNAMLVQKDGQWFYSKNTEGQLIEKPINIKF